MKVRIRHGPSPTLPALPDPRCAEPEAVPEAVTSSVSAKASKVICAFVVDLAFAEPPSAPAEAETLNATGEKASLRNWVGGLSSEPSPSLELALACALAALKRSTRMMPASERSDEITSSKANSEAVEKHELGRARLRRLHVRLEAPPAGG